MLGHLEVRRAVGDIQFELCATTLFSLRIERKPSGYGLLDEVPVGGPLPRAGEIERAGNIPLAVAVVDLVIGIAKHDGQMADQLLHHHGHELEIGIGPVSLQHGELGIVTARDSFVTETPVQLEDLWKSGHQEPLEVKLGGDPEEEIHAQGVVMGLEGFGCGSSRNRLHHRGLDFQESPLVEESPDLAHDCGALEKDFARGGVGDQIQVALAIAGLRILNAVPLVGKWAQGFGKDNQSSGSDTGFSGSCREALALNPSEISNIELRGHGQRVLVELFGIEIDLHASSYVGEIQEATLAHVAVGGDASGEGDGSPLCKGLPDFGDRSACLKGGAVGINSKIAQGLEFLPTHGDEFADW